MHIWINIFTLIAISILANTSAKETKKCYLDRIHSMIAYNCASLKLTEIPKNIKTSTEVS